MVPWGIFREIKDGERESPETLFRTYLRPMGLNVLGYQSNLGIVAILPISRMILLKAISCIITSLLLFWCPYMVINVSVQCNGGLLPDIILLTLCDSIGEPF